MTKKRCRRNWCSTLTTGWSNWYFRHQLLRPAGQVIAQYYEFLRLGREGYTKVQNASYQVAAYLADEIAKLGPYEFICTGRPDEGIPAVCFKLKDGEDPGYTLYDL